MLIKQLLVIFIISIPVMSSENGISIVEDSSDVKEILVEFKTTDGTKLNLLEVKEEINISYGGAYGELYRTELLTQIPASLKLKSGSYSLMISHPDFNNQKKFTLNAYNSNQVWEIEKGRNKIPAFVIGGAGVLSIFAGAALTLVADSNEESYERDVSHYNEKPEFWDKPEKPGLTRPIPGLIALSCGTTFLTTGIIRLIRSRIKIRQIK